MDNNSVWAIGYSGPAKKPCKARKITSWVMLCEMPHRNDVRINSKTDARNSLVWPKRRDIQPVSGNAMALDTANEVITQVPCSELTPRLPEMVGNATLAIVVSSTCINVASDRPIVASTRLGGRNDCSLMATPHQSLT